jgi:hypothetical protein
MELIIGNLWMCASCLSSIVAALFFHEPICAKKDQADSDAQDPDLGVAQASVMITYAAWAKRSKRYRDSGLRRCC